MARRLASLLTLLVLFSGSVFAQGLTTTATKDDWEEINFEFNSYILSDGYPSLLRIAELLGKNPSYKVNVVGHTDWVGSHPFNDKLAMNRANAVRQFLEKYGAAPGQITVSGSGERSPKVDNNTKEGRFMNRRVTLSVSDGSGRVIGAGGAPEAIHAMEATTAKMDECCSQILKRLDKLDEILALLKDLKDENAALRRDLNAMKGGPPAPPPPAPAPAPAPVAPAVEQAVQRAVDQMRQPRFALLGLNAGIDDTKNLTFTGRGRYFAPFGDNFAFQAQGEYMYFRTRKEAQFDFGLVNRWKAVQFGGFSSFRTVSWKEWQNTGTLGQAAFTLDFIHRYGKVGVFGTKGFLDKPVVNTRFLGLTRNLLEETYLSIVDQAGASGTVALGSKAWFEGNIAYLRGASGIEKPGGTLRFVFPLSSRFALTAEGGFNETLVQQDSNGRATFGFLFGNFTSPKEFASVSHPVPVDVPRIRYEVLTRTTKIGNAPPIADAGGDRIGVGAGPMTLDGSASYDPDGDPITFEWSQISGPAVSLSGANTARASFTAAEGQIYSFRLLVKDPDGAQAVARATVSTREPPKVRIIRFTASPILISTGGTATLNYLVENATSVEISGVSQALNPTTGTAQVSPTATTTYTLTARNSNSNTEDSAVTTVVVEQTPPRFVSCAASPATIRQGGTATLQWNAVNADTVEVPGVGTFGATGTAPVSPASDTTYNLIARSRFGEATCTATVTVQRVPTPVIVEFRATPMEILRGASSTLTWQVTGADTISISQNIGTVDANGTRSVSPTADTTYTLTATNASGSVTADAQVRVLTPVSIISFTVSPSTITRPGEPVTFTWETSDALEVHIDEGVGPRPFSGSLTTAGPSRTKTYTLTAIGRGGSVGQRSVTVTFEPPGGTVNQTPVAVVAQGPTIVSPTRSLTLDGSPSFDPERGALTYRWRSIDGRGTIASPTAVRTAVTLNEPFEGEFRFELTVTDPQGISGVTNVVVRLVPATPLF